jgi:Ca2+-binding EF-hand superfamily protein
MDPEPADIEELRETFSYNDFNKDGRIEFDEFREMLAQLEARIDARRRPRAEEARDIPY